MTTTNGPTTGHSKTKVTDLAEWKAAEFEAMVDKANDALDSILNSLAHMTDDELQEIIARTLADVAVHKAAIAERDSR